MIYLNNSYNYVFSDEILFASTKKIEDDDSWYFRFLNGYYVYGPDDCYDYDGTINYHYILGVKKEDIFYGDTLGEALHNYYMSFIKPVMSARKIRKNPIELYFRINNRFINIEKYVNSAKILDKMLKEHSLYQYKKNNYGNKCSSYEMIKLGLAYDEILFGKTPKEDE